MKRALLLVGLVVTVQALAAGCCLSPPAKNPCADQERTISELQAANGRLEANLKAKDAEISRLNGELLAKDAQITDLTGKLAGQPPAPPPGPTGFEDLGDVSRRGGMVIVTIASDLLFDSGKAVLKQKGTLPKIAAVINDKYPGQKIRVRGHTDSDPIHKSGWKDNWDLGFNRARTVALQLISDGVPEKNVEMDSLSDTESSGGGKAKDRRVEIQVLPAGSDH